MTRTTTICLLTALLARTAGADITRCATGDATVHYNDVLFSELSGDSGWIPSGSPAQVRLTARVAGQTTVAMGLRPMACWEGAMRVTMPVGQPEDGLLDFAYGAELHLYAQIHTSILGNPIDWSGEIPLPTDFLLGTMASFAPALLPGSAVDHVSASDTTSPLELLGTDLIGTYIGIPGISGGLHLDAIGALTTTYRTNGVVVGADAITASVGVVGIAAPAAGFGPALDLPVAAGGALHYAPALTFDVAFDVKILGLSVANWQLFAVTLPLPSIDRAIVLGPSTARVPLPEAPPLDGARVDFATGATQTLAIHNAGEGPLMLEAASLPTGVTAAPITIDPGADGVLTLTAADGALATGQGLVLATNDPDQPSVTITLGRDIGGTSLGDDPADHGGCNAGGRAPGLALVLAAVTLLARRRRGAASVAMVVLAGCAVQPGAPGHDTTDPAAGFSPIGQQVIGALRADHDDQRGRTWQVASDGALAPGWLVQTPLGEYWDRPLGSLPVATSCAGAPGCDPDFDLVTCTSQADCTHGGTCTPVRATVTAPGGAPRSLCVGHSDAVVDQIYDLLVGAQDVIDISSLVPPDGRFEAAIRNALAYLSRAGRAVRVRVLYGMIPGGALSGEVPEPADVLPRLVRDLAPGTPVRVTVASYRDSLVSWDHAKIIAVDHRAAIVGGHNLMTRHYLQEAPVFDLSMQLTGSAVAQATRFTDVLWHYVCRPTGALGSAVAIATAPEAPCEEVFAPEPELFAGTGTTRMIAVGRLGTIGDHASDDAQRALIDAARSTLRISQQDLGGVHQWPEPLVQALVAAIVRGVDVELVISNIDAYPDHLTGGSASYSNGWSPGDVVQELATYAADHPELVPAGMDLTARLCTSFHVAALRHGSDEAWPDGSRFANHAKLIVADDAAFYLGSQNMYPANLAEFGYIVDDAAATRTVVGDYYTRLWSGSQRTAASCVP